MRNHFSRTVRRLRTNPFVIGIVVIGALLVGLANAGRGFGELHQIWAGWTAKPQRLETTWQGTWKSRGGHKYTFAMQLEISESDAAEGVISWQLIETPPGSLLAGRVNDVAQEFVKGRFDRANGVAILEGYRVSDPTLLALDTYRLQIRPDKVSFVGMTRYRGDWEAEAAGSVILVVKR